MKWFFDLFKDSSAELEQERKDAERDEKIKQLDYNINQLAGMIVTIADAIEALNADIDDVNTLLGLMDNSPIELTGSLMGNTNDSSKLN